MRLLPEQIEQDVRKQIQLESSQNNEWLTAKLDAIEQLEKEVCELRAKVGK